MSTVKSFHVSDVLSVTTGALLSNRLMEGIYDILGHMTNDPYITTLGLLAVSDSCKEELLRQYPLLKDISAPDFSVYSRAEVEDKVKEFVAAVAIACCKEYFDVMSFSDDFEREGDLELVNRINPNAEVVTLWLTD